MIEQQSQKQEESTEQDYLLGCDADELARLAFQHQVWAQQTHAHWERAGFRFGSTVLDIGCGPGFASIDLAHLLGSDGRVIAADGSATFLAYLEYQARVQGVGARVTTLPGDLHDLQLEAESLDGAYARWVFCFLPRPEQVVKRVAAALRPGARLAVTDYFNYGAFTFAPRSAALDRVIEAVKESWRRIDGDLDIQGRMPALVESCGLEVVSVHCSSRIARPGSPLWNWPRVFFDGFLPKLVDMELLSEREQEAFNREWRERTADPASFLSLPPIYELVAEKR